MSVMRADLFSKASGSTAFIWVKKAMRWPTMKRPRCCAGVLGFSAWVTFSDTTTPLFVRRKVTSPTLPPRNRVPYNFAITKNFAAKIHPKKHERPKTDNMARYFPIRHKFPSRPTSPCREAITHTDATLLRPESRSHVGGM